MEFVLLLVLGLRFGVELDVPASYVLFLWQLGTEAVPLHPGGGAGPVERIVSLDKLGTSSEAETAR